MKNVFLLFFTSFLILSCQRPPLPSAYRTPDREFRGVWIATIENIDWPSKKALSTDMQQSEFTKIIKFHSKLGLNAAFVQVRAASDAFYAKQTEPWSEWLTGKQGLGPNPAYDPMEFMINTCHQNGLEFHAWLNLNRGIHKASKSIAEDHITKLKPEWFLEYGGYTLYNFGLPEVREYIINIVRNIVKNYKVDGIHFDDYFYPYSIEGQEFPDEGTFKKYPNGFKEIEDWRRNNINILIKAIAQTIEKEDEQVKFGISPFGVWRNQIKDPLGSKTDAGQSSYDNLYADTRLWALENWIDYTAPQVYFSTKHTKVPYTVLNDWWIKNTNQRHLYVGMGAYKVNKDSDQTWKDPSEIGRQIRYNRSQEKISGAMFFSSKSLINNELGLADSLRQLYKNTALAPTMPWKNAKPLPAPIVKKLTKKAVSWAAPPAHAMYTLIYEADTKTGKGNIMAKVYNNGQNSYTFGKEMKGNITLTFIDRLSNESKPSSTQQLKTK